MKNKMALLTGIVAVTFLLLGLAAFLPRLGGVTRTTPQGDGGNSFFLEEPEDAGDGSMRVTGCVTASELSGLLAENFAGILDDVSVEMGEESLTVSAKVAANAETIVQKFPSTEGVLPLLQLAHGAPVTLTAHMAYDAETGFSISLSDAELLGVPLPAESLDGMFAQVASQLNARIQNVETIQVHEWEIRTGGLYYSATLPAGVDKKILYPVLSY